MNNETGLFATQNKLSIPILNRLVKKMNLGLGFRGIKVCDGLIIDGHHRYIASLLTGYNLEIFPSNKSSITGIIDWKLIELLDTDFDSLEKIQEHNKNDALRNEIRIENLIDLLNNS